jgi:DNA invertase Pin-like site-specific DNA recombinase
MKTNTNTTFSLDRVLQDIAAIEAEDIVVRNEGRLSKDELKFLASDSWSYATPQSLVRRKTFQHLAPVLIFYIRISKLTDESVTFDRQRREQIRMAKQDGFTDEQIANAIIFEEEGSAYLRKHRPKHTAMMKWITRFEGNNPVYVYIYEISRLARDANVANRTIDALQKQTVNLRIATQPQINLQDPQTMMFLPMLIQFAENESRMLSGRATGSQESRAAAGIWRSSAAPYGYTTGKKDTSLGLRSCLVPDDTLALGDKSKAWVVNEVFRRFDAGDSATALVHWMNEGGVATTRASCWSENSLMRMLRNPHYAGYVRHNEKVDGERRPLTEVFEQIVRDKDGNYLVAHEAIVDPELWGRVNAKLLREYKPRGPQHTIHRLSGIVICANCGAKMFGQADSSKPNKARTYRCSNSHRKSPDGSNTPDTSNISCMANSINADALDEIVYQLTMKVISTPEAVKRLTNSKVVEPADPAVLQAQVDTVELLKAQLEKTTDEQTQVGLKAQLSYATDKLQKMAQQNLSNQITSKLCLDDPEEFKAVWENMDKATITVALKYLFNGIKVIPTGLMERRVNHQALAKANMALDYGRVKVVLADGTEMNLI